MSRFDKEVALFPSVLSKKGLEIGRNAADQACRKFPEIPFAEAERLVDLAEDLFLEIDVTLGVTDCEEKYPKVVEIYNSLVELCKAYSSNHVK